MNDIKDALDTAFYMGDSLSDAINASSYERMRQEYYKWRDNIVPALSSPHPEAREEDIRKALTTQDVKEAIGRFRGVAHFFDIGDMSAESDGNILADAIGDALEALSRLAAQKDEGQVVDVTALRLLYNMAACSPAPKEQREEIIRNHMAEYGYTVIDTDAATEPRPAEETPLQRKIVEVYNREPDGRKGE